MRGVLRGGEGVSEGGQLLVARLYYEHSTGL